MKRKHKLSLSLCSKSLVIIRETLTSLAVGGQTTSSTQHWKNCYTMKVRNPLKKKTRGEGEATCWHVFSPQNTQDKQIVSVMI